MSEKPIDRGPRKPEKPVDPDKERAAQDEAFEKQREKEVKKQRGEQ